MRQSLSQKTSPAIGWLVAGLVVTALITVFTLIDPVSTRLIAAQVEAGYPSYAPEQIDGAVTLYVVILAIVGAVGLVGWITALLLVRSRRQVAFWIGAAFALIGVLIAVMGLTTTDTSGVIGLAPVFGWLLLLPPVIGVGALVAMRRGRAGAASAAAPA